MMTKYPLGRHVLAVVGLAAVLAGCNGKEDFSDAVIGGSPLGSGVGAGANFRANDACAPRVIGALVDAGTVRNIRYECDGFYGYTGVTGLPDEVSQNFFVCPMGARSIKFLLGGRTASLPLGTGYFRSTQPSNVDGCQYDYGAEEYVVGSYDADGIYLFSLSDLIEGPARIDAETNADTVGKKQVRNASALLQALDSTPGDEVIAIDQLAHEIVFDEEFPFVFPDGFLTQDYVDFVTASGDAQEYLDVIQALGGQVSPGGLPDESAAVSAIRKSNLATNAGIYRFQMIQSVADVALVGPGGMYENPVLYGSGLCWAVAGGAINPDADENSSVSEIYDDVLLPDPVQYTQYPFDFCASRSQFMPAMLVTRRGYVSMGGAFDVVDVEATGTSLCTDTVDYGAFEASNYAFQPDRGFSGWRILGEEGGLLNVMGRIIGDYAFNGEERASSTASDYGLIYPGLPEAAYDFNAATDRTSANGVYCGQTINDQPLLSLLRAGTVSPNLDAEVMSALADPQPLRYTLNYIARAQASDEEPNTLSESLKVTIHPDGAVFTDFDDNGNPYDGINVPAGEQEIGMVSSVFRSPVTPANPTLAVLNLLVYNYGPLSLKDDLPKYGSHFRGRLVPQKACGENALFAASSNLEEEESAYWFDPYAATEVIQANPVESGEPGALARYAGLRTRAYGYIEAVRSDCPPSP